MLIVSPHHTIFLRAGRDYCSLWVCTLLLLGFCHSLTPSPTTRRSVNVRVCRNKHCCKQAPQLLETLSDLLGTSQVESSGCLSHCEKGPNVEVRQDGGDTTVLHEIMDTMTAIVQLELLFENDETQDCPSPSNNALAIPKLWVAAAKVMERATKISDDPTEQERLLTSVISKLATSEDITYSQSTALAHAYSLRGRARLDQEHWTLAIEDSKKVVSNKVLRQVASELTLSKSYRAWADAEEHLEADEHEGASASMNRGGSNGRVVAVLQQWQQAQPTYRTKLQREIQERQR